jgi:crossover junction endodeoxyribonuclease RusA
MNSLAFVVYGLPAPQGSKRHMGNGILVESSKAVKPWRQDVRFAALACIPHDWDPALPMAISVTFRFKRPKAHIGKKGLLPSAPQHCTSARAGDVDKLSRALMDALTSVAYADDRQVVSLTAEKRYTVGDEPQGALITLMPFSNTPAYS